MRNSLILSGIAMLTGAFSAAAQAPAKVAKAVTAVPSALPPDGLTSTSALAPAVETIPTEWYAAPLGGILALLIAVMFYKKMMASSEGNDTMKEIAQHVREGAMAYLFRQRKPNQRRNKYKGFAYQP